MEIRIEGKPVFAHIIANIEPGETIVAESDAMASMSAELDMKASWNGGFFAAILKKIFGGESLFINYFKNNTNKNLSLHLTQATPGDIVVKELNGNSYCLQKNAYIASDLGVKLGVKWAGFGSLIGGEGLFKLVVSGNGIVDSGHLVAYEPTMKLKPQLAGGIFSSFFGGEGFVTRVEGKGKIYIQTRNLSGLATWVNRHI